MSVIVDQLQLQFSRRKSVKGYTKPVGLMFMLMAFWGPSVVHAEAPVTKRFEGELVSPSAAFSYYGSAVAHTDGLGSTATRAPEIRALARALSRGGELTADAFAARVFEYVQKNIETEFLFGLSKGGRGAAIDQSGTAFDQAELMVEILREGGQAASYRLGTITLTAAQFGKWTGLITNLNEANQTFVVNAQAACKMLADGGIPATVNGASSCGSVSGNLTTVTLAHLWVVTNGKSYDPGFKANIIKGGIDVASAMGCGTMASPTCGSNLQSAALTGASQGTANGASYIQNINEAAASSYIQARALQLQQAIEASDPTQPIENVVGGNFIDIKQSYTAVATLPYQASVQATWSGKIPDQYRTKFQVQFMGLNTPLYADEISGKRVRLATIAPSHSFARTSKIYLNGTSVAIGSATGTPFQIDQPILSVNHPFAGGQTAGTYADDSIQIALTTDWRDAQGCVANDWGSTCGLDFFQIYTLYLDVGRAGPSREQHFAKLIVDHKEDGIEPEMRQVSGPSPEVYSGYDRRVEIPSTMAKHAAQTSQAIDLVSNLIRGHVGQLHHLGGSLTGGDKQLYLNIVSAFTSVSRTASTVDAVSAFETATALTAALEGSVLQEGNGAWETSAAVSMFKLSNAQGYRFYLANSANISSVLGATSNYSTTRKSILTSYASSGYELIIPSSGVVGSVDLPGSGTGLVAVGTNPELIFRPGNVGFLLNELYKGGGAVSITDPAKDAIESAKSQSVSFKDKKYYGIDLASGYVNLTPSPDIRVGVGDGALEFTRTYSSGKSGALKCESILQEWPNWRWACEGNDLSAPSYIGGGWDHNFNITASWSGSASEALGENGALRASHSIAATYALLDLNRTPTFQSRLAGIFGTYSLINKFAHNLVSVSSAGTFVKLPDGEFDPPPDRRGVRLTQSGSYSEPFVGDGVVRSYQGTAFELVTEDGEVTTFQPWQGMPYGSLGGVINNRPTYAAIQVIKPSGIKTTFLYASTLDVDTQKQQKILQSVSNSYGNNIEFSHDMSADSYNVWYRLLSVGDVIGREGVYSCSSEGGPYVPPVLLAYVNKFSFDCSVGVADLTGGISKYTYYNGDGQNAGADFPDRKIHHWFTPGNSSNQFLTFEYDPLLHVSQVQNSEGEVDRFFIANVESDRYRFGEQRDPLGGVNQAIFDKNGSEIRKTDPLGRITQKTYDTSQRVIRTIYPEGNATEFTYDVRGNRITECQIAKGRVSWSTLTVIQEQEAKCNTGQGDLLTSSTFVGGPTLAASDCANMKTCNLVDHVVDPRGYRTNYTWSTVHGGMLSQVSGLNGAGTACAVGSTCPETDYGYTSYTGSDGATFYLLTSKVEKIDASRIRTTAYTYDTGNHYVLKSATVSATGESQTQATCFTFDAIGNLVSSTEPLGATSSCS